MVLGELGRFPIEIYIKSRMVRFWSRLVVCDNFTKTACILYKLIFHMDNINNVPLFKKNITKTGWKIGFQIDVKTNLFEPASQTSGIQTNAPITVSSKRLSLLNHILQNLILKEPGYFDPSHSRRGGGERILRNRSIKNIKCVVLVDSYDPPESIGTKKKFKTYLVWRHSDVISDVISKTRKSPKIAKIMGFRYFFKQKLHFWAMMFV